MDNLTHSLMGATLAIAISRENIPPKNRAVLTAVIASSLPDVDFVLSWLAGGGNLNYVLQHRGWTHTLIASPFLALASVLLTDLVLGKKKRANHDHFQADESSISRAFSVGPTALARNDLQGRALRKLNKLKLLAIAWMCVLVHLFADFWNDYGIHPFSPWLNRWFYGDFIVILEPMLWLAMLPLVLQEWGHKYVRWAVGGIAGVVVVFAVNAPYGGPVLLTWLTLWTAGCYILQLKWGRKLPPGACAGISVLVALILFKVGSVLARSEALATLAGREAAGEKIIQTVVSPFPGDPLLWRAIVASTSADFKYIVRLGTVSVLPSVQAPLREYYGIPQPRAAPVGNPTVQAAPSVHWVSEYRGRIEDYAKLMYKNCGFASFLKFARVPFWSFEEGRTLVGDLRYDHERGLGFAKFVLGPDQEGDAPCPGDPVSWDPPLRIESR